MRSARDKAFRWRGAIAALRLAASATGFPPGVISLFIDLETGVVTFALSWRAVLDYFAPAVQFGMTATPLREESRDSYEYFGNPVYTYSLRQGIEDGYLAPYKVIRIDLDKDTFGWRGEFQVVESLQMCAADRATTIHAAIDPKSKPSDLARPGHMFPLRARDGGVLIRAGQATLKNAGIETTLAARNAGCQPLNIIGNVPQSTGALAYVMPPNGAGGVRLPFASTPPSPREGSDGFSRVRAACHPPGDTEDTLLPFHVTA